MRTIIDLPKDHLEKLSFFAKQAGLSRTEIIRRIVSDWMKISLPKNSESAFGLWADKKIDSIKFQKKLRDEWK